MGEGNEGAPIFHRRNNRDIYYEEIFHRRNIIDKEPLWQIGPDGKYHCTPGGLERAREEWLEEIRKREE
jgi:hypothetical protein